MNNKESCLHTSWTGRKLTEVGLILAEIPKNETILKNPVSKSKAGTEFHTFFGLSCKTLGKAWFKLQQATMKSRSSHISHSARHTKFFSLEACEYSKFQMWTPVKMNTRGSQKFIHLLRSSFQQQGPKMAWEMSKNDSNDENAQTSLPSSWSVIELLVLLGHSSLPLQENWMCSCSKQVAVSLASLRTEHSRSYLAAPKPRTGKMATYTAWHCKVWVSCYGTLL